MSDIDEPRDNYLSAKDFRERTLRLGDGDPDTKLYPADNETLVWMKQQAAAWSPMATPMDQRPHILEVGCGHGRWAKHLEHHYQTYLGLDPVQERIESARQRYATSRAHFFHEAHPIRDGHTYNRPTIVFAVDVLQHLGLVEAQQLFARISLLLQPGGKFITWDGCLGPWSLAECEQRYRARPHHMIPKPISAFEEAVPTMRWELVDGCRLIAVKL